MRTLIGYAILLIACFGAAQTSQEFHSRYGEPDIELFRIRDGIGLTVYYGSDGFACQMEIKAQHLLVQRPQQELMAPEVVDGILVTSQVTGGIYEGKAERAAWPTGPRIA